MYIVNRIQTKHLKNKKMDNITQKTSDSISLTRKEIEVLDLIASGNTYDQIARQMQVGISTVRKHVSSSIKKLDAKNSTHACALAVKYRIIFN